MSDIVKISWSGGKDSTASVILHLIKGDKCKVVYYIPYLVENIPLIFPEHYNFIQNTAKKFETMGCDVYQVKGVTYWEHVHAVKTKGINRGNYRFYGLGLGFCLFRNYSKISALNKINVGYFDYQDIGIAFDEIERQDQLTNKKRSILAENKITEKNAKQICECFGLLSPNYKESNRDGCAICPNAPEYRINDYIKAYPEAKQILTDIDIFCSQNGCGFYPFRNSQNFTDRMKILTLF